MERRGGSKPRHNCASTHFNLHGYQQELIIIYCAFQGWKLAAKHSHHYNVQPNLICITTVLTYNENLLHSSIMIKCNYRAQEAMEEDITIIEVEINFPCPIKGVFH